MTKADLHHLVDTLPDEAVDGAALLIQRVIAGQIDPEQAWAWTPQWQDQLRESLADLAAGRSDRFAGSQDFLASL